MKKESGKSRLGKTKSLWIYAPEELIEAVDAMLKREGRNGQRAELIRRLLRMYHRSGGSMIVDNSDVWGEEYA